MIVSDKKIERLIREAIFNTIFENKGFVTPKNKILSSPFSISYEKRNKLMEGYYATYPIEKVIDYITNRYSLAKNINDFISGDANGYARIEVGDNNEKMIAVYLPTNKYDKKNIESDMSLCGYYLSLIQPFQNCDILYFEKRIQNNVNDILKNTDVIYHVSPLKYKNKITEIGLIPKTLSKLSNHPERIYFTLNKNYCGPIAYEFYNTVKEKYESETNLILKEKYRKELEDKSYVIFKVNIKEIKDKINFYYDPNMMEGIYTKENIPPTCIEIDNIINF